LSQAPKDFPITPRWFQCYMKYFLHCNVGKGIMDAEVEYLQVSDFKQLASSIHAIWPFILSPNNQVSSAASKFFVSLHIRLDPSIPSADKKSIFEEFILTCVTKLRVLTDLVEQKSRVLGLLLQFLERLQKGESVERPLFQIGENITAYYKPVELTIRTAKYAGFIRGINPRVEGKEQTYDVKFSDGDEWHAAPERYIFEVSKIARVRRTVPVSENVNSYPSSYLASNIEFFHFLFELLGDSNVGEKARSVLQILPKNVALTSKLQNLVCAQNVDWKEHLPAESLIKLLYGLEIVEQLSGNGFWSNMFIRTKGLNYLLDIFYSYDTKQMLASSHSAKCIGIIVALISRSLTQGFEFVAFLTKLFQTLHAVVEHDSEYLLGLASEIVSGIIKLTSVDSDLMSTFAESRELVCIASQGFFYCRCDGIRKLLRRFVSEVCDADSRYRVVFSPLLLSLLPEIKTSTTTMYCGEFLEVVRDLMAAPLQGALNINWQQAASTLATCISQHPFRDLESAPDAVFCNLLKVANSLLCQNCFSTAYSTCRRRLTSPRPRRNASPPKSVSRPSNC